MRDRHENLPGIRWLREIDRDEKVGREIEAVRAVGANDPVFDHGNSDRNEGIGREWQLDAANFAAAVDRHEANRKGPLQSGDRNSEQVRVAILHLRFSIWANPTRRQHRIYRSTIVLRLADMA